MYIPSIIGIDRAFFCITVVIVLLVHMFEVLFVRAILVLFATYYFNGRHKTDFSE